MLESFVKITPQEISQNPFDLFSKDWVLITAGDLKNYNTMTASWGGVGYIWNKPVATIYIRPQRYTYEFVEKSEYFTLTVLPEAYRDALKFCGSKSGRDYDKAKESGLTPIKADDSVAFSEASLIVVCKKLYHGDLSPEGFDEKELDGQHYPQKDYHRMYIGEIVGVYKK